MVKEKAQVDEIFTHSKNKSTPVLLKFQNGDLRNAHKDTTIYFPATCESDLKKRHAVVVTHGNVYSGPIADDTQDLVDNYVCVRNKTTNKVRIIPIDQVKLINHVYEDKKNTVFSLLSKESASETAIKAFGSRKQMRSLANRQRTNVSIDVIHQQLETTIEKSEVTNTQEEVVDQDVIIDTIRPKFNKDATTLQNVYDLYDVIPKELMERLDEEVDVLMSTEIDDIPITSEFLKTAILKLKTGPRSNQSATNMKIIVYMDALLKLIKTKTRNLNKFELSKITEKVENDIRERFTSDKDTAAMRTTTTNEKAICYFLVLAFLISDDFQLDLNVLSTELSMSKLKITKYGALICAGCKSKTNILALKLPSKVAPVRRPRVKK